MWKFNAALRKAGAWANLSFFILWGLLKTGYRIIAQAARKS